MTYRKLAVFPLVVVALFVIVELALPPDARLGVYLAENESSKIAGAVGCFAAAYAFDRGDYLRRAWLLHASCYIGLLARDLLRHAVGADAVIGGVSMYAISSTIVLVANFAAVGGSWILARAWSIAGMELPGSRAARWGLMAGAAVLALAISGSGLYVDGAAVLRGNAEALTGVASDLGDIFSLCLIAPVLLTAIAMGSGVLRWPWGLLTTSMMCWLLYDLAATFDVLAPGHADATRLARETLRALAGIYGLAAGLAQRRAIHEP